MKMVTHWMQTRPFRWRPANCISDSTNEQLKQEITSGKINLNKSIRQVRWVIRTEGFTETISGTQVELTDAEAPRYFPVPKGLYMNADADDAEEGRQDRNDVDKDHYGLVSLSESIKENSPHVAFTTAPNDTSIANSVHNNHFASVILRSDDFKYAVSGEVSRVGFYLDPQLPWLGIDIDAKYFSGAAKTAYKWDSNTSGISSSTGKMLKYTITYKNLSQELLETTTYNRKGAESDKLSEPTVSLALPYLESLSADNFQYVNYQDDSNGSIAGYYVGDHYTSTAEKDSDDNVVTPAQNLDDVTPQWTWHIENEKGEFVSLKEAGDVSLADVDVETKTYADVKQTDVAMDEEKNPNPYFVTKPISTNVLNRKIVNFKFSGTLEPGQRIVVELMVPLDISNNNIVSTELMQAKAYGFKNGSFRPYIPDDQGKTQKMVAYEVDSHDVNDNGSSGDMTLTITSQAIALLAIDNVTQMKTSTSDLDSVKADVPVRVQEGGNYSYSASMQNASTSDAEYTTLLFYDVLPYENDTKATDDTERKSKWNGYLIPESVQLKRTSSGGTSSSKVDPSEYTVWVGPITKKNGSYELQDVDALPKPADGLDSTQRNEFYRNLYQNINKKESYFVKLSDLMSDHENGKISDAEYDKLVRGIRQSGRR
ncbi:MAG: hypothetical protein ACLR5S_03175 [Ruminococcus sp.]